MFFFFKQKTADEMRISDWSSDVCSSDLLAKKHDVVFYPFFLEGVATDPSLNLGDGIHPNAKGIAVIVEGILPLVRTMLKEDSARQGGTERTDRKSVV